MYSKSSATPPGSGAAPAAEPATDREFAARVEQRLTGAQLNQAPVIFSGNLLVGTANVGILWESLPDWLLLAWWLLVIGASGWRLLLYRRHGDAADATARNASVRRQLLSASLVTGMAWGALCAYSLTRLDPVHSVISLLMVSGMVGGAIATASASRYAYATFTLPALLPPVSVLLSSGNPDYVFLALCMLAYVFFTWRASRHIHSVIRSNVLTNLKLERSTAAAERLAAELYVLSTRDPLTGVGNRRAFDETLAREWQHALRDGRPLSLLMVDVDAFKNYNDALGHQPGDHCLRLIAERLLDNARRGTDLVARYGGEEFVVLLPDTTRSHAEHRARNMLAQIEALAIPHPDSPAAPVVTVSIGVASLLPSAGQQARQLVQQADMALYQAKSEGRNCVRLAESGVDAGETVTPA